MALMRRTELRIPLLNARISETEDFGCGFSVRPATDAERAAWGDDAFIRDVIPHRVIPSIPSVLICTGRNYQDDSDSYILSDRDVVE